MNMLGLYNKWRTVAVMNGTRWWCTRCGDTGVRSERLGHRCDDSQIAFYQSWIKMYGEPDHY